MDISVVGVNHRRAAVALREKLAVRADELPAALEKLRAAMGSSEEVILSTCNRVELYLVRDDPQGAPALPAASAWLASFRGLPAADVAGVLVEVRGAEAVRHLFKVAGSLDSMVLGETQILSQVKDAYHVAKDAGHTGRVFNQLFQRALFAAKKVHSTTAIGEKNVSVPSVAARLAGKVFQDLASKRVLILGAGETGTLTLQAFKERGVADLVVVNRTIETARDLVARVGGHAAALSELDAVLPAADIVIACLSAEEPIVVPAMIDRALKTRRGLPIFLVDIAVPRNIHPDVNRLDNVYLFNIDDLEGIVNRNLVEREREVAVALPIIDAESAAALKDVELLDVERILVRLRERWHGIGEEELRHALDRLPETHRDEVAQLVRRILNKVLHAPTAALKEEAHDGRSAALVELASRLFGLDR